MGRPFFFAEESEAVAQETFCGFLLVARHAQFFSALQKYDVAALKPGANLANAVHVDDGRAVNADKVARIELIYEGLHCLPDVVGFAGDVEGGVVSFCADPVDIGDLDEENAATHGDGETLGIVGLRATAVEQRQETLGCVLVLAARASIASSAKSAGEAIRREGLKKVIDRIGIECVESVAVVCGNEDSDGHLVGADGFDDAEAIHLGHLYVEKDKVGVGAADGFNGGFAIAALTDDIYVGLVLEQTEKCLAG